MDAMDAFITRVKCSQCGDAFGMTQVTCAITKEETCHNKLFPISVCHAMHLNCGEAIIALAYEYKTKKRFFLALFSGVP